MEKVFFVENDKLGIVNKELASGGHIKNICPVAESVSSAGNLHTDIKGNVYAYVVIEYPDNQ